jgi:hypothetical protein
MSRFTLEPDSKFDGHAVAVELSDDPERNGRIVGYATGSDARDIAFEAAQIINRDGHQPAGLDEYTVAAGQEF